MASPAIRASAEAAQINTAPTPASAAGVIPGILLLAVVGYAVKFIYDKIDTSYGSTKCTWDTIAQPKCWLIKPTVKTFFITKNLVAFIKKHNGF